MSGWKTVEVKKNKKVKKAPRDSDFDSDDDYSHNGGNTDYYVGSSSSSGTAAGQLLSAYHLAKAEKERKRREPTRAELAATAVSAADALAKRREEQKASQAETARLRRKAAQEHAKRAGDVSQWPTVAEALAENSEAFMDHFDAVMDEDPIVSKGGIGALLLYAPSIFEKFTHKTRLTEEEASGEVLLTSAIEDACEGEGEGEGGDCASALDTFVYYKSLLSKMPEVRSPNTGANGASVRDGFLGLLSAVWGTKGLKNALASKDSGRGGLVAVELTFDQLWALGLQYITDIAEMFVNSAKGEPHAYAPQALLNFQRIFTVMTNSANKAEDRDAGRVAIAKAAAALLASGHFAALFCGKASPSSPSSPTTDKKKNGNSNNSNNKNNNTEADAAESDAAALVEVVASAIRYVSAKQLTTRAFSGINFKDAVPFAERIITTRVATSPLGSAWSVVGIELLARPNPTLAKAAVAPLLDALEAELSGQTVFSPAESTTVVVLSTIFALHAAAASGALRAHASKAPRAAFVFLAVAKASKLFDVPPSLEETIVSAAKKAGAEKAPKMTNSVKVSDLPTKEVPAPKQGNGTNGKKKKASGHDDATEDASAAAAKGGEEEGEKKPSTLRSIIRVVTSMAMIGVATAYLINGGGASGKKKAAAPSV